MVLAIAPLPLRALACRDFQCTFTLVRDKGHLFGMHPIAPASPYWWRGYARIRGDK